MPEENYNLMPIYVCNLHGRVNGEEASIVNTFQQEHQVEDPVRDGTCLNMHSAHLCQGPVTTKIIKVYLYLHKKINLHIHVYSITSI